MTTVDACLPCQTRGHTRAATPGYRTCDRCSDDLRDDLADIRDRHARLDIHAKMPATGDGATSRSIPHSTSPANDHVIALTDQRSMPLAALGSWARMIEDDTCQSIQDTTVPGLVRYLLGMHAHTTRQYWVDDYAEEIHALAVALRRVTGDPKPRPIGHCPTLIDRRECGTELYAPLNGDTITCRGCERQWPREEWLRLGQLLEAS